MHVGQTEIAAGITVRQSFVIEAEQMQHRRVQIMHEYNRNRASDFYRLYGSNFTGKYVL